MYFQRFLYISETRKTDDLSSLSCRSKGEAIKASKRNTYFSDNCSKGVPFTLGKMASQPLHGPFSSNDRSQGLGLRS